ncbi:unnamed protein product [Urochloa humidicola]
MKPERSLAPSPSISLLLGPRRCDEQRPASVVVGIPTKQRSEPRRRLPCARADFRRSARAAARVERGRWPAAAAGG